MKKMNRKFGVALLSAVFLTVAFFAAAPEANAQVPRCELDWNCDGVVNWDDIYEHRDGGWDEVKSRGFYSDIVYYVSYIDIFPDYVDGGYYHEKLCGTHGNLDWNNDGTIEIEDAYDGGLSNYSVDTFYVQLYIYLEGDWAAYRSFYPNSDCTGPPWSVQ